MAYDVETIADWFLCKERMTHKKLQKLCYYAQAWSYALYDRPMIDDVFEAWVHGPVSPKLYKDYRGSYLIKLNPSNTDFNCLSQEDSELLERVWITYGGESANSLEAMTHREEPWREARRSLTQYERCNEPISTETMKSYYRSVYSDGEE